MNLFYCLGYLLIINFIVGISSYFIYPNTFFFGYLKLKWKRLFRTLITININIFFLWFFDEEIYTSNSDYLNSNMLYSDIYGTLFLLTLIVPSIALISWLIKPFVLKED
jgi:uncharacterized membrane-anchored protein YitT (DUF2179 family)